MKNFFQNLFGKKPVAPDAQKRAAPEVLGYSPAPEFEPFKTGDLIQERWKVHRVIHGGMGLVYVVYDRKWREVFAAKTFQNQVFVHDPNIRVRFEKEALAWVNLDLHQNIAEARFLHVIDGQPFLFLEYVAGGDLSRWIGTPRLTNDLSQVLRFSVQFCDGMRHVIAKGVKAHRDIKPQNCLVTQDGILKVTDFGLAKVWDDALDFDGDHSASENSAPGLSQTGTAAGTCTHMAPEQFKDSKHVDVRADIYSFGVMLFQMVSGELPFLGRSFKEFAALHTRSTAPLHQIQNHRIRSVIEKCLRKNPEDRYASFDELRHNLAAVHKAETGFSTPEAADGNELTAHHLVNKGKSLGDLGQIEESIVCFEKATALDPSLAEAWLNKGASLTEIERHADGLVCFDRALALKPTLALAWAYKGHVLLGLGRLREALSALQKASELNPDDPAVWYRMGCALAKMDKHEDAIAAYRNVVRLDPRNVEGWFNMGHSVGLLGRHADVIKCCERALEIDSEVSRTWILKGLGFCSMDRFQDAISCFQRAEKLGDTTAAGHIANSRRSHSEWYFRLGSRYQQESNHAEAIVCYEKGLAINPSKAVIWVNKGTALLALKRASEAVICFDQAILLDPRDFGAWNNKGIALMSLGQPEDGLACITEAYRLRERSAGQ